MKQKQLRSVLFSMILSLALPAVVFATPSRGVKRSNNCSACHTRLVSDRMQVTGEDYLLALPLPLPPVVIGRNSPPEPPLGPARKTFRVAPGKTVRLSIKVLRGPVPFAVQIKNFDNGAKKNSSDNLLFWMEDNAANNFWLRHQRAPLQPYFTKNASNDRGITTFGLPITYHFDLRVGADTPLDVYELTFATVGKPSGQSRWYQEEKFYVEVYCPYDIPGDFNRDCRVDNADFALFTKNWLVDCLKDKTHPACVEQGQ